MNDFQSLLTALKSITKTAEKLGVSVQAVSNMKSRNLVAPSHWPRLIEIAREEGYPDITTDRLVQWYSARMATGRAEATS